MAFLAETQGRGGTVDATADGLEWDWGLSSDIRPAANEGESLAGAWAHDLLDPVIACHLSSCASALHCGCSDNDAPSLCADAAIRRPTPIMGQQGGKVVQPPATREPVGQGRRQCVPCYVSARARVRVGGGLPTAEPHCPAVPGLGRKVAGTTQGTIASADRFSSAFAHRLMATIAIRLARAP